MVSSVIYYSSTGPYRGDAASPQLTQQLSDISAGPVYAAWH